MLANPSVIKRPVLERGRTLLVGFTAERYSAIRSARWHDEKGAARKFS